MKRFYKTAEAAEAAPGWTVTLDGKPIRTPAKSPFRAPTRAVAEAAAAEWEAQEGEVKPATMPITRSVNTAIDRTGPEYDQVVEMVAEYGGSDLLCYRAEDPEGLRVRQAEAWDPLLDWAHEAHGARLLATSGVMHALQPETALAALGDAVRAHDAFELTALYDLVALSGSLVIGLAVSAGRLTPEDGWATSRVDETWQQDFWGVDEEAARVAEIKRAEFHAAAAFLALLRA